MTTDLFFENLLLPTGWAGNVRVGITDGNIATITPGAAPGAAERHAIGLPGMNNLHSHSFQRAIAGLTEYRGDSADNFWSWRDQMYRFALKMNPDDVEAVARQAFAEMLEGGFTAVAEFHYLHHDQDGKPYANIAELAARIAAAADATGIDLVLLPVFYAHSNFGGLPPNPSQRRFICTLDQYTALHTACTALAPTGVAPHSLRAVTPDQLAVLVPLSEKRPFHLHISEQTQEVADCLAWSGTTPVDWLLSHAPVGPNWCLIHATHATAAEQSGFAATGAVAGLCPITEANLGDGLFDARRHTQLHHGAYGIGTDSNILIDTAQELRLLEYSQRLLTRTRNAMATKATPATGTALYTGSVNGGAKALGLPSAGLRPGAPANIVSLDTETLGPLARRSAETALDAAIFAARRPAVETVWVRGRKRVENGAHVDAPATRAHFNATLAALL